MSRETMSDASQRSYTAIVTVGDRGRARPVHGVNKGFLELAGAPVFTHVLAALERSRSVDRIYVVGPKSAIETALAGPDIPFRGGKPVRVLEQWENLYLNVWNTFQRVLEETGETFPHFPVLVVPCDIPLLVPEEVEEFVGAADMERFDYVMGVSSEGTLSHYYPQRHRKGIRLMCFHLREGSFRQNNLHLVNPLQMTNRSYIQKVYDYRLQREWGSIVRLLWEILQTHEGTLRIVGQYLFLHLASLLYRIPGIKLHTLPAALIRKRDVEKSISGLLGTRFATAETHFGGAALDIDTPEHYGVIQENFEAWIRMQREALPPRPASTLCLGSEA